MCKIAEHPELYAKANEVLRRDGISSQMPGYELLRKAIVTQKVEGKVSLEEVTRGMVIPCNKDIDLERKNRTPEMQWMIEAFKSIGFGENENVEVALKKYIEQCAQKLDT